MFFKKKSKIAQEQSPNDNRNGFISSANMREIHNPISELTELLKNISSDTSLSPELFSQVQTAYRNSVRIHNLGIQMCAIEELENNNRSLNIAPYLANDVAMSVVYSVDDLLNVNPITFNFNSSVEKNEEIFVDYSKIAFVLRNMLSNSFRRINYSGVVSFAVKYINDGGERSCVFTVCDTPTVNEAKIEDSDLGMRVMKDITYAHHGKIKEFHKENQETQMSLSIPLGKDHFGGESNIIFVEPEKIILPKRDKMEQVVLPVIEVAEQGRAELIGDSVKSEKQKLLIIEDHKDIRLYLQILFANEYTLLMADNGAEGLKIARRELPDLVITDVMMPVMNGFECCKLLKENLKTCHIPVILLTAMIGDEDVVKGIELGADDYILKPFNPEILRIKVRGLIKSRMELKQIYSKLLMPSGDVLQDKVEIDVKVEDPLIVKILDIVSANMLNADFSVKKLSEMLNMSQPTLYRRVKQITNLTIIELIRGVRLKRSAELLKTRQYTVQEVAEMVGYNDIATFRKHFIDSYGTTPSTFSRDEAS